MSSSLDNTSKSLIENSPPSVVITNASSDRSILSVGASLGFIRSRNLSPSSEMLVVAHELRKITLDNNRIFFDIFYFLNLNSLTNLAP